MRIINDRMRLWPPENDRVLAGAADAAKLMTGREVTAAAITAALASEPGE